jgi:RNA ligase
MSDDFVPFQKIGRLSRDVIVTEKIDGTNALIEIGDNGSFRLGSRTRWIPEGQDNHGFAMWAYRHKDELMTLGVGRHFGEWWGHGIERGYGLQEKRFSLFNTHKWGETRPACCHVVPIIWSGNFDTADVYAALESLKRNGSLAAPGFMRPEGVVVYHAQANVLFKKTFVGDEAGKGREPIAPMGA